MKIVQELQRALYTVSMRNRENNFAFIDSQNVYKGVQKDLGWELDWVRFRVYLKHKYDVDTAYLFIGFIPEHNDIYTNCKRRDLF